MKSLSSALTAVLVLAAPLASIAQKDAYKQSYQKDAMAGKFELKNKAATNPAVASKTPATPTPAPATTSVANTPPAADASKQPSTASTSVASTPPAAPSTTSKTVFDNIHLNKKPGRKVHWRYRAMPTHVRGPSGFLNRRLAGCAGRANRRGLLSTVPSHPTRAGALR